MSRGCLLLRVFCKSWEQRTSLLHVGRDASGLGSLRVGVGFVVAVEQCGPVTGPRRPLGAGAGVRGEACGRRLASGRSSSGLQGLCRRPGGRAPDRWGVDQDQPVRPELRVLVYPSGIDPSNSTLRYLSDLLTACRLGSRGWRTVHTGRPRVRIRPLPRWRWACASCGVSILGGVPGGSLMCWSGLGR